MGKQSNKKAYRVSQIEGKITWQVEELWDGGVVRGPFGTKESAILKEEKIAADNGFIDDLVLEKAVGTENASPSLFPLDQISGLNELVDMPHDRVVADSQLLRDLAYSLAWTVAVHRVDGAPFLAGENPLSASFLAVLAVRVLENVLERSSQAFFHLIPLIRCLPRRFIPLCTLS